LQGEAVNIHEDLEEVEAILNAYHTKNRVVKSIHHGQMYVPNCDPLTGKIKDVPPKIHVDRNEYNNSRNQNNRSIITMESSEGSDLVHSRKQQNHRSPQKSYKLFNHDIVNKT